MPQQSIFMTLKKVYFKIIYSYLSTLNSVYAVCVVTEIIIAYHQMS